MVTDAYVKEVWGSVSQDDLEVLVVVDDFKSICRYKDDKILVVDTFFVDSPVPISGLLSNADFLAQWCIREYTSYTPSDELLEWARRYFSEEEWTLATLSTL